MADPMRIRAQAAGDKATVRVLMSHEMETGQRKDSAGKVIPAWFIQEVTAQHNGKPVMTAQWGPGGREEPVPAVQRQGREGRRQDHRLLGRQQGRQAHRRSDGDLRASAQAPSRQPCTHAATNQQTMKRLLVAAALAAAVIGAQRRRSPRPKASPNTARCSKTATRPSCSRPRARRCGRQARGPKNASLEHCDLGKGPGQVKGAFVELPRYFADTEQGAGPRVAPADLHGDAAGHQRRRDRQDAVRPRRAGQHGCAGRLDRGRVARHEVQPAAGATPRSSKMLRARQARVLLSRAGPYDFACASCHGEDGKRIRLQDLPDLTKNPGDGIGFAAWPAYRVSSGELWGMQRRLNDCYRQQRFPYPGLRLGRDDRARRLHGRQRQGRRVDRAGDQALKR